MHRFNQPTQTTARSSCRLSFLTDPIVVVAILEHLELPHTPPPISPARGPPQGDLLLDQTPAFDPTEAEVPEFVFDQSLPVSSTTERLPPAVSRTS